MEGSDMGRVHSGRDGTGVEYTPGKVCTWAIEAVQVGNRRNIQAKIIDNGQDQSAHNE